MNGLFKAGTVATSSDILKLPTDVNNRVNSIYNYLLTNRLGSNNTRLVAIRNGHIQQDNNLPVDGVTGSLISIFGVVPLTPLS